AATAVQSCYSIRLARWRNDTQGRGTVLNPGSSPGWASKDRRAECVEPKDWRLAMASKNAPVSSPVYRVDRRSTANVAYGLASLRRITVRKVGKDDRPGPALYSKTDVMIATASDAENLHGQAASTQGKWTAAGRTTVALDSSRPVRTIAEIEHGFIAL